FYDFNNDGLVDIYLNMDFTANELWINNGNNTFEEIAASVNADNAFNEMGMTLGDYDNDGDMDVYASNITTDGKFNIFLKNISQGNSLGFEEVAQSLGVSENGWDWGTTFFDANNDGWVDLAATNGYISFPIDRSKLWLNNNGQSFRDISNSSNFNDDLFATTLLAFDMDRDGDLDLLQTLKENENTDKPVALYDNTLDTSSEERNYLVVKPRMTGRNHFSIGATVSIKTGALTMMRVITAGTSFYGQEPAEAFFGIASNTIIDELRIQWPDNTVTILNDITANQILTVTNEVISEALYGCTDFRSCNFNPLATIDDGSCEYYESSEIAGATESGFGNIESYSYGANQDTQLRWTVEGGELVSGQGSNSITVKWGLNQTGTISIAEQIGNCLDITKTLEVNLDINNRSAEVSIARIWNEALLEAIREDFARPTVHARNLFHSAIAMYDTWAVYKGTTPYLLDTEVHGFTNTLEPFTPEEDIDISIKKALSYASYRLLMHRFKDAPDAQESSARFSLLMEQLEYDTAITSTDYKSGDAAAFGNYVAQTIIAYGLTDNSREVTGYDNAFYQPINPSLDLNNTTNADTGLADPNRWQPLQFSTFIDQSGNPITGSVPPFLSAEWGKVHPFALPSDAKEIFTRDGNDFTVYNNPEAPPKLDSSDGIDASFYKWNFSLVSQWSSHLDPSDGVIWDISPNSIGNIAIDLLPNTYDSYPNFYDELEGGDTSTGYSMNPKTGQPYEVQMVPRGDYTRVLAEFWADGPDSETPPGHWFTILNYVTDHPLFTRKFNGSGEILKPLEWDVKSYFILGGAMHDAAVSAWGIKGWHDYIRPISAIRYMCELGQSTDNSLSNYHPNGITLKEGYIEVIESGDPLSGDNDEHINKIKLYAWLGHDAIRNGTAEVSGVGWVLAENWWPYQRPSFVTPPFAGFVSGHSTFSRAAAETLTLVTGDTYFPGGMGEFVAKKDTFLAFEKGPSVDVKLQWATYRDASDQTSLSRIWGGIHPPVDDIPGRIIGEKIGIDAYNFALPFFEKNQNTFIQQQFESSATVLYPNPVRDNLFFNQIGSSNQITIFSMTGRLVMNGLIDPDTLAFDLSTLPSGIYVVKISGENDSSQLIIKN
ncbi:FG-GAP-like repeat-containing protein, partial [Maribacter sp.]|nr:FG-GAP-like repeat-containing protein [Maribacter sp.]